jgi:hydroxypyruvate reductase
MQARRPLAATCEDIYRAAIARLAAARLVSEQLAAEPLPAGPVRLLALGKAAAPMLEAARAALGERARDALCVHPEGTRAPEGVRAIAAGHPRPTPRSLEAGLAILAWADANRGTPALVLLSGGGSALAVAPAEPLLGNAFTFEEKVEALAEVMRAGATIQDLNAVRKHLSALKGGRLGERLVPAPVRVLVLSDVPGDDLSTIASGPLVPDPTSWGDVFRVLEETGARDRIPPAVRRYVDGAVDADVFETPEPDDPRFDPIAHRILAGPVHLARAAAEAAGARGFHAEADPAPLTGDVAAVAARLEAWARANAGRGPRLLALGGEPTIRIPRSAARADGGRAQHLALLAARAISGLPAAVLAAGSDGRDGPTEHAGAVVDGATVGDAAARGVDLDAALAEARSGPACEALGAAIPRFETGTHLCDLMMVAVE